MRYFPGRSEPSPFTSPGHALVALCSEHADPVTKVTILPAGQSLGATQQLPTDERHLYSESYLNESLAVRLGGRAAELLVLGEASTGAANDLAGATELATKMVRDWGFSLAARSDRLRIGGTGISRPPTREPTLRRGNSAGHRRGGEPPPLRSGRAGRRSCWLSVEPPSTPSSTFSSKRRRSVARN